MINRQISLFWVREKNQTDRKCRAIILAKVDPPQQEYLWNLWYNAKHGPERFDVPGILSWRRFEKVEGLPTGFVIAGEPKYLSLYDMADAKVRTSEVYTRITERIHQEAAVEGSIDSLNREERPLIRIVYEQIAKYPPEGEYEAPYVDFLHTEGFDVPDDRVKEFEGWYIRRMSEIAKLTGFVAARLMKMASLIEHPLIIMCNPTAPQYFAIYDFDNASAFETGAVSVPKRAPADTIMIQAQFYKRFYPYKGFKYTHTLV
jgi:hypothetical protein